MTVVKIGSSDVASRSADASHGFDVFHGCSGRPSIVKILGRCSSATGPGGRPRSSRKDRLVPPVPRVLLGRGVLQGLLGRAGGRGLRLARRSGLRAAVGPAGWRMDPGGKLVIDGISA